MQRWPSLASCLLLTACFEPDNTPATGDGTDTTGDDPSTSTSMTSPSTSVSASASAGTTSDSSSTSTDGSTTEATDTPSTSDPSSGDPSSTTAATTPEIEVSIDGVVIDAGDALPITDTVDVGASGSTITVTIENIGTGDLDLTGVVGAGDVDAFDIDQATLATSLAPAESSTFTIAFAPDVGGLATMTASIGSDDADENPFDIVLTAHTTSNLFRLVSPAASPSGRFNSGLVALPDGRLVLYGGRDALGASLADTWIFDPQAETWTDVTPASSPPARFAHDMAYADDDLIVLFGGKPSQVDPALADTWIFDSVAESWTELMIPSPGTRFQHAMVELGGSSVLLVGGRPGPNGGAELGDTWLFDAEAGTWTNLAPAPGAPARSGTALAYDGDDTVTLFGGFLDFTPFSDTYNYSIASNTWTLAGPATNPGARAVLMGDYLLDGRMFVWSGKLDSCCTDPAPGTFAYDPVADSWANLAPPAEPTARFNYAMAAVPGRNRMIIFGGLLLNTGVATAQSETWEYVGESPL